MLSNDFLENARQLVGWLNEENDEPEPSPDDPGPDSWWRIIRPGSQVRLYQRDRNDVGEGTLLEPVWQDGDPMVIGRGMCQPTGLTPPPWRKTVR